MFENIFPRIVDTFTKNKSVILSGLNNTLTITLFALFIGLILGSVVAIIKILPKKKNSYILKTLDYICSAYINLTRGTPVTVQLLIVYFALLAPLRLPSILIAILVFGLNSGAYVSEIIRSGILSVDKGQMEAARSLGLKYKTSMGSITMPQAIKNTVPTLGNEFIALLKETSVAGFISVMDITQVMKVIVGSTYDALPAYLILAVIYLILVYIITLIFKIIERKLRKSDIR